ncbi:MAG: ABC transporter permease [Acidobacteriia bacterium]|nr:ABC transporter permease [Terriglobia bacterium]
MFNPAKRLFRGFSAVFYKETLHMRRDSMAMMLALIVPIIEMVILGAAIDTNVRQVHTAVYDQSGVMEGTQTGSSASRDLINHFINSDTFKVYKYVHSDRELNEEMVSGRARVGLKIPLDFDRKLLRGETAQVMVIVDGSDSSTAGTAVNVAGAIGLEQSLQRVLAQGGSATPSMEIRPKVMFNPDSRSPNFFLPGLIAVLMLMITVMLTAFSVVREKERGTLEQLMVTPVRPLGLMLGKIMPYFFMGLGEMLILLAFMRVVFRVPVHGSVLLLMGLTSIYLFVNLAIGMLISVRANTQAEAIQASMALMLPSIFLSGYVFPRETMPTIFHMLSNFVPATYMINIFRGIILRGAGFPQLWLDGLVLAIMGVGVLLLAARKFERMVV